jgi:hypothetical protein
MIRIILIITDKIIFTRWRVHIEGRISCSRKHIIVIALTFSIHRRFRCKCFKFLSKFFDTKPLPAISLNIVFVVVSEDGEAASKAAGAANEVSFFSTASFITLATLLGITVVDGNGVGFCRCRLTSDTILFFAAESALLATLPTAPIPLSRNTSMAFIDSCLANGATLGAILANKPAMVSPRPFP